MIAPDAFRINAYRVLRVPVSASASDIHKAAASMRRAATLGLSNTSDIDIPGLGDGPRGDADIRAAVGRLANPVQRLTDRLFWFYQLPELTSTRSISSTLDPAGHDRVLRDLFNAIQGGLDDSGLAAWVKMLRAWHAVTRDDDYWALALTHEDQGGFEPSATFAEVEAVRSDAVRLAGEPLILAARAALAADERGTVRRIVAALSGLADTGTWASAAIEEIATPEVDRFVALCRSARERYGTRIIREPDAGAQNKPACDEALAHFRTEVQSALDKATRILPQDHELVLRAREEAALYLSAIATDYTWADDFISSETLNKEALALARSSLGAIRIQERLSEVGAAARKQRVFGSLKPIEKAPSLSTINGIGFKMYGKSDPDPETDSYLTTYYFVALFIPVFPIARYRIREVAGNRYSFLGKVPLRKVDRWHLGIALVVVLAGIVGVAMSPEGSPSSASSRASQPGISTSRSSQLATLKARIDQGRAQSSALESQLQPVITQLTEMNDQLKKLSAELKTLDEQNKGG